MSRSIPFIMVLALVGLLVMIMVRGAGEKAETAMERDLAQQGQAVAEQKLDKTISQAEHDQIDDKALSSDYYDHLMNYAALKEQLDRIEALAGGELCKPGCIMD